MLIIIISRSSLKLDHVGSKTRLLGHQATQVSDLGPLWPSCLHFTSHNDLFQTSFGVFPGGAKMKSLLEVSVLTSLLMSRVSCLSPWARQNFPAPLKTEEILSSISCNSIQFLVQYIFLFSFQYTSSNWLSSQRTDWRILV